MLDVIDANLGELSQFHETHGFYVHGVSIDAAVLPEGWERRAIRIKNANTRQTEGLCVEAHDLAISKLIAFREKDRDFVRVLVTEKLVSPRKLLLRLRQLPQHTRATQEVRTQVETWIKGVVRDAGLAM